MDIRKICERAGITLTSSVWDDEGAAVITLGSIRRVAEQAVLEAARQRNESIKEEKVAAAEEEVQPQKPRLYLELKDSNRVYYNVYASKLRTIESEIEGDDYAESVWGIEITCTESPALSLSFETRLDDCLEPSPHDIAAAILYEIMPKLVLALMHMRHDSFRPA
jgi:hypothetical protein